MATPNLLTRLEFLEQRVTVLETLPARIDALADQIVQQRGELRAEFSALRAEMRELNEETRREMHELNDVTRREMHELNGATRREMRELNDATRREMRALNEETRLEMRALNEETKQLARDLNAETRTHMLVLHEDLVERIKRIGEGPPPGTAGPGTTGEARPARRRRGTPRG